MFGMYGDGWAIHPSDKEDANIEPNEAKVAPKRRQRMLLRAKCDPDDHTNGSRSQTRIKAN